MSNQIVSTFKGIDLTGKRFTRWLVLSFIETKGENKIWLCRCDCGTEKPVYQNGLTHGFSTNCGCLRKEKHIARITKHGSCGTPEYVAWQGMKSRCYDKKRKGYKDYGGRGIVVCERWLDSFETFLADMGPRPPGRRKYSVGRINNDKNYEPGNCRWETWSQQSRNTRRNHMMTYNGETMTATDWAIRLGVDAHTLMTRSDRGWSDERALTTPIQRRTK